jgi:hypothetical protein
LGEVKLQEEIKKIKRDLAEVAASLEFFILRQLCSVHNFFFARAGKKA